MTKYDNVVAAFTAEQVVKMTGLTKRQLAQWDATGFFSPDYASENRRSPYSRIYSFHDLVGLRTISVLMNAHNVPVIHLKDVAKRLSEYTQKPWSKIKFKVWKRKVQWVNPEHGLTESVVDGQYLMLEIADIWNDMRAIAEQEKTRQKHEYGQIEQHRYVAHNLPVVAGSRIPVRAIQRFHEAGYSIKQIITEYPTLNEQDVIAAIQYSADGMAA